MKIMPSSRISNDYKGFSEYAKSIDEPITVTSKGYADLIVMSVETYEKHMTEKNLNDALLARYLDLQENGITHPLEGVTERIAKRLGVKNV